MRLVKVERALRARWGRATSPFPKDAVVVEGLEYDV